MNSFPKIIQDLIEDFAQFPGIGKRSAERIVYFFLKMSKEKVKKFIHHLENVYNLVKPCRLCNNFSINEICPICSNPKRQKDIICIVEEPKDILAIEKTSHYNGLYYVLLGAISPLEEVGPENLNINKLLERIKKEGIKEIIISTDPDNEGELTAHFLIEKLSPLKVKIYRISIGVPLGTQIEYIDPSTLGMAFVNKKEIDS